MEQILDRYIKKLEEAIASKKAEVRATAKIEDIAEKVRDELSQIGRNLLSMFYQEMVRYIEQNNPQFIENNKEKWEEILDRASALKEYGLYVAPIELIQEGNTTLPMAIGLGSFIAAGVITKLLMKKVKLVPAAIIGAVGGLGYNLLFGEDEIKKREMLIEYIDDAGDWIKTALNNMYKIFKDAA